MKRTDHIDLISSSPDRFPTPLVQGTSGQKRSRPHTLSPETRKIRKISARHSLPISAGKIDLVDEIITSEEESEGEWCPSPPCSAELSFLPTPPIKKELTKRAPQTPVYSKVNESSSHKRYQVLSSTSQTKCTSPTKVHNVPTTPLFARKRKTVHSIPSLGSRTTSIDSISDSESETEWPNMSVDNNSKGEHILGLSPVSTLPKPSIGMVDIIESSDEEDSTLFNCTTIIEDIEEVSDKAISPVHSPSPKRDVSPKRRWLDSITAPDKDTQGTGNASRRRKGPEVSRLHKLMELKKTEEMAVKHIIASRQGSNFPDSSTRVVIKAGSVVGNLYKTMCVAVYPSCHTQEVRVVFTMAKKMENSLSPGVTLNLIPPWQEFTFSSSIPLIFCSTFEVIAAESSISQDPGLCCSVRSPQISKKQVFCSDAHATPPTCTSSRPRSPVNQEIIEAGTAEEEIEIQCNAVQGIVQHFICNVLDDEAEEKAARPLVDWFEGFSISNEENLSRTKRHQKVFLLVQESSLSFVYIEIPSTLWVQWIPLLRGVEGCAVRISSLVVLQHPPVSLTHLHGETAYSFYLLSEESHIEEIEKSTLSTDVDYVDPFLSLHNINMLYSPHTLITEGMRINIIGKTSYVLSQSNSYSRCAVDDFVFLFDGSFANCTNVGIQILDEKLQASVAEQVSQSSNLLLFRDVVVKNATSPTPLRSHYLVCDYFSSVSVIGLNNEEESILPRKFLNNQSLCEELHAVPPTFSLLKKAQFDQRVWLQSIFSIKGELSKIWFLQEGEQSSCLHCGLEVSQMILHKSLRSIAFCHHCCRMTPCELKPLCVSATITVVDGTSVEVELTSTDVLALEEERGPSPQYSSLVGSHVKLNCRLLQLNSDRSSLPLFSSLG